eukprot:symbB.v1.2.039586.t1/scaffold6451.1/size17988/1
MSKTCQIQWCADLIPGNSTCLASFLLTFQHRTSEALHYPRHETNSWEGMKLQVDSHLIWEFPWMTQDWPRSRLKVSTFFGAKEPSIAESIPPGKDCSAKTCKTCECSRCPICPDCPEGFKPRDVLTSVPAVLPEKIASKKDNCPSCPDCPPCPKCPKECQPCLPLGRKKEEFL